MSYRANRFMRSISASARSKSASKSRSRAVSNTRAAGSTNVISVASVAGKTSMKSPFKFNKRGNTIKKRVKIIEKTLGHDEVKYLQSKAQVVTVSTTPTVTLLNACGRGDTIQDRTADSIRALQLEISGQLQTGNNAIARMMVIGDKVPQGAAINFSAVTPATNYAFAGASSSAILPYQMMNFNNTSLDEEFRIFFDKTFNVSTTDNFSMPITIKQKIDVECEYKGGNFADIRDLTKNALYLVIWGSNSVGGVPTTTTFTYDSALYFQDS